ncbi:hypothetical protein AMECASPLE_005898 [Ameca splendens]|uniref:Uncharacterized protein n=1 Tax=Ameca splendens TaxID=208324 RepID=A0ABV0ZW43_9TELE
MSPSFLVVISSYICNNVPLHVYSSHSSVVFLSVQDCGSLQADNTLPSAKNCMFITSPALLIHDLAPSLAYRFLRLAEMSRDFLLTAAERKNLTNNNKERNERRLKGSKV